MTGKLQRSLGLTELIFYGVGSMVGAGIYSVIGAAAGQAGYGLWVSFLLAGAAAFITVLSYAEMSSISDKAGAEYQFLKMAFPKWRVFSFMAGAFIALNATATCATVSLAFAGYLGTFVDVPHLPVAFGLLVVCTLVNMAGIKQATWFGITLICVEVAGLLLMIYAGLTYGDVGGVIAKEPINMGNAMAVVGATSLIFFVFIGFEDVANLSEEAKKPRVNIPRALIAGVLITSVIYILVAFAVLGLTTPQVLAGSKSPLEAALANARPWMGDVLSVAALFATSSTALISLVSISRLLFGMAREGFMPKPLAATLPVRKTPWAAALTLFLMASALLPLGEIKIIASISSFGVLVVFTAVQLSVITLRIKKPELKRGFRIPLIVPIVGVIVTLALLTQFEKIVYMVGGGVGLVGLVVYWWLVRKNAQRGAAIPK